MLHQGGGKMAILACIAGAIGAILGIVYWASADSNWAVGLALILLGAGVFLAGTAVERKK